MNLKNSTVEEIFEFFLIFLDKLTMTLFLEVFRLSLESMKKKQRCSRIFNTNVRFYIKDFLKDYSSVFFRPKGIIDRIYPHKKITLKTFRKSSSYIFLNKFLFLSKLKNFPKIFSGIKFIY